MNFLYRNMDVVVMSWTLVVSLVFFYQFGFVLLWGEHYFSSIRRHARALPPF